MIKKLKVFRPSKYKLKLVAIIRQVEGKKRLSAKKWAQILKMYPKEESGFFSKSEVIAGYRKFAGKYGLKPFGEKIVELIRMKPIRTLSGVTPVTVLTKPYSCPGKCIFCPTDVKMPKSYLFAEPGAQRALRNKFDPYLQTYNRLKAFADIGHNTSKVELIILGGTWSFYPEEYQIWFAKRCFEAMSDFAEATTDKNNFKKTPKSKVKSEKLAKADWESLFKEQKRNEKAKSRCVGLVVETRPDYISKEEVIRIRKLGGTKVQIGYQSLKDSVLKANKRGHDVRATKRAMKLLRQAGFKIHAHWMANLLGSSPKRDVADFKKIFSDKHFRPDELKIYPTSLIESAELVVCYKSGKWKPYSKAELLEVISKGMLEVPEYCRVTRVIRDFSSDDIVAGNKKTNFRQIVETKLKKEGKKLKDIRFREIKDERVSFGDLKLKDLTYKTQVGIEVFLQFVTKSNKIVGFLRLSLPNVKSFIKEIDKSAMIREVHVYGKAVAIGKIRKGKPQHIGLGKRLIEEAKKRAEKEGFKDLAVISAVGTRIYYRKLGFVDGKLYQHMGLG